MIGTVLSALVWPLALVALASSAYLAALTASAALASVRPAAPRRRPKPSTRFAMLVPARDEEALISRLLRSVRDLDYPKALLDVYVIADNCLDSTEARAREAGARVLVRRDPDRLGKGYALAWAIERVRLADYDAVAIVDADSTLDRGFLRAMDARLAAGSSALQGYYGVSDPLSTAASLRSIAFALMHYVRPLGKTPFGGTCGLKGNGMAFSARLLEQQGWRSFSVVEDAEQGLRLAEKGYFVEFAPEARVYSEMPASLGGARDQNLRWEAGRWLVALRWSPALLWRGLRQGSLRLLDAAVEPLIPPLSVIAALAALTVIAALSLGSATLAAVGLASMSALSVHVLGGMLLARVPATAWRSLSAAPIYLIWKLLLYCQAILGAGAQRWVRTPRAPSKD